MANPYKSYTPTSITQLDRAIRPQTISVVLRGRDDRVLDPDTNLFSSTLTRLSQDIVYGEQTATRRMVQKGGAALVYEFMYPPTQIIYDNIGYEIVEIPRPLLSPIVEKKSQQNNRVSFDFLVAKQFDGMMQSIDEELRLLQFFSNSALPVSFENFDARLNSGYWLIAEFSIQSTRTNTAGQIAAAQCKIGLIEYTEMENKFINLPRLKYTSTKKTPTPAVNNQNDKERPPTTEWENIVEKNKSFESAELRAQKRKDFRDSQTEKKFSTQRYGSKASTKNGNTSKKSVTGPTLSGASGGNLIQSIWNNNYNVPSVKSKTVTKVTP